MASTIEINSIESRRETPTAMTYFFTSESRIDYRPGQYVAIRLEGIDDPRGPQRPFTLSTSPTEKGQIGITVKLTGSPYKEELQRIAEGNDNPGENLRVRGPMGGFTLDTDRQAVMIAGGIGITPFRSMIRFIADRELGLPVVLICSNETPEDITFREELDSIEKKRTG